MPQEILKFSHYSIKTGWSSDFFFKFSKDNNFEQIMRNIFDHGKVP